MYTTFTVRRVFTEELERIVQLYSSYNRFHCNIYRETFIKQVMLCGQVWAAYDGDIMAGCCCLFPGDMEMFAHTAAAWNIQEMTGIQEGKYLVLGYLAVKEGYSQKDFFPPFALLRRTAGYHRGKEQVLYLSIAHIHNHMGQTMKAGFRLAGLRGLDSLVPHYIFIAPTEMKNQRPAENQVVTKCPYTDTKEVSRLCEDGFEGYDIDSENNILFTDRS